MKWDAFISHASEDKKSFVQPLAELLKKLGAQIWFDRFEMKVGDGLSRSIDYGLKSSNYGILVLSKHFINKDWTEYELRGLISREINTKTKRKIILPIWHGVSKKEILRFSPSLADKFALNTANLSLQAIAFEILSVIRPDIYKNYYRRFRLQEIYDQSTDGYVNPKEVILGPIRHETLPAQFLLRIKIINHIFFEVFPLSLEKSIDTFQREVDPEAELTIWEILAAAYLDVISNKELSLDQKREIYGVLLQISCGEKRFRAESFKYLTSKDLKEIKKAVDAVVPKIQASKYMGPVPAEHYDRDWDQIKEK